MSALECVKCKVFEVQGYLQLTVMRNHSCECQPCELFGQKLPLLP